MIEASIAEYFLDSLIRKFPSNLVDVKFAFSLGAEFWSFVRLVSVVWRLSLVMIRRPS